MQNPNTKIGINHMKSHTFPPIIMVQWHKWPPERRQASNLPGKSHSLNLGGNPGKPILIDSQPQWTPGNSPRGGFCLSEIRGASGVLGAHLEDMDVFDS